MSHRISQSERANLCNTRDLIPTSSTLVAQVTKSKGTINDRPIQVDIELNEHDFRVFLTFGQAMMVDTLLLYGFSTSISARSARGPVETVPREVYMTAFIKKQCVSPFVCMYFVWIASNKHLLNSRGDSLSSQSSSKNVLVDERHVLLFRIPLSPRALAFPIAIFCRLSR